MASYSTDQSSASSKWPKSSLAVSVKDPGCFPHVLGTSCVTGSLHFGQQAPNPKRYHGPPPGGVFGNSVPDRLPIDLTIKDGNGLVKLGKYSWGVIGAILR